MDKVEKFRKHWRKLGAGVGGGSKSGLTKKDRDHLDRLKNYHDDFGDMVNGIEARVSESSDFDEELLNPCPKCGGEAKFETVDDFPWVGGKIECADCGHHVYEILSGPDETRSREEMMDILIDMWNGGEDADDDVNDWSSSNEEEFTVKWLIDDEVLGIEVDDTETVVVDLDDVDSFDELVRQVTMELKRNHNGMLFDYDVDWVFPNEKELLKRFGYTMDESDSEGVVEIVWSVDYPKFGIESGDAETFFVDYDDVLQNVYDIESNRLKEEVCVKVAKMYPGLEFEPSDFDITNEDEFWTSMEQSRICPYDESRVKNRQ